MDVTKSPPNDAARLQRIPSRENTSTKPIFDAVGVTRAALSGGVETWFDSFWYREVPEPHNGRIREYIRLLRAKIVAARIPRAERRIDLGKAFAITVATLSSGGRRI